MLMQNYITTYGLNNVSITVLIDADYCNTSTRYSIGIVMNGAIMRWEDVSMLFRIKKIPDDLVHGDLKLKLSF